MLDLPRSSYYYKPIQESEQNLRLMRIIDELYLETPFYGSRQMTEQLKSMGESVNRKRIQRLMRIMGLEAMFPGPKTSIANKDDYKYPYLLKNLNIREPNEVWGTDITYIPIETGYIYLVAILDLYSRFVISWELSNTLESEFCVHAIENGLKLGKRPRIINSDQGSQYTSKAYTETLKKQGIEISMSGKGRCWDNIFVERLWRSFKHEEVYIKNYSTCKEAKDGAEWYFNFYNQKRLHSSLGYKTPQTVHYGA